MIDITLKSGVEAAKKLRASLRNIVRNAGKILITNKDKEVNLSRPTLYQGYALVQEQRESRAREVQWLHTAGKVEG